jgi:hypothetical protein
LEAMALPSMKKGALGLVRKNVDLNEESCDGLHLTSERLGRGHMTVVDRHICWYFAGCRNHASLALCLVAAHLDLSSLSSPHEGGLFLYQYQHRSGSKVSGSHSEPNSPEVVPCYPSFHAD